MARSCVSERRPKPDQIRHGDGSAPDHNRPMKERTVHHLSHLAMIDSDTWKAGPGVPVGLVGTRLRGESALAIAEQVLERCHWLRKTGRPMSEKSRTEYGNSISQAYRQLADLGYHLQKPWNIEQRHIEALCQRWAGEALSASTIQGRLMVLSWWGAVLGRPGLVRGTHQYQVAFGERVIKRKQSAERDISPRGVGMEREEVVRRAIAIDATFGHIVLLQFALGLREKEAIQARPWKDMVWGVDAPAGIEGRADVRSYWRLDHNRGSKGGRPRTVYLNQGAWQAEAILRVRDFLVTRGRAGGLSLAVAKQQSLGWSSSEALLRKKAGLPPEPVPATTVDGKARQRGVLTGLAADMRRYTSCCARAGFTRADLGFTGHSFRHAFAHRELEAMGFVARIVAGEVDGSLRGVEAERAVEASGLSLGELKDLVKREVSQQLGHARPSVTAAYYGRYIDPTGP